MHTTDVKSQENVKQGDIPPQAIVMGSISNYFVSFVIKTAVDLGIFKALKNGITTSNELADHLNLHPNAVQRLLRALVSVDLLAKNDSGEYHATKFGETLQPGPTPQSIEPVAEYILSDFIVESMLKLGQCVRTGEPSFDNSSWYESDKINKEQQQVVNRAMEVYSKVSLPAILKAHSFAPYKTIVDIAGGLGQILAGILQVNPEAKGVLYDLPSTITRAQEYIDSIHLAERCELIGGDMFKFIPTGGDLYIISKALNDWDNDHVLLALKNIRAAMSTESKLIIIEMLIDESNPTIEEAVRDLLFLAITPGGGVRTKSEYIDLIEGADMEVTQIIPAAGQFFIIKCQPKTAV